METPVGAGPSPTGPSSPHNPVAASSQEAIKQPLLAEVTTPPSTVPTPSNAGPFGFLSASWESPNLLGDMWGLRPALSKYGITLSVIENAEVFGNVTGARHLLLSDGPYAS